MQHITHLLFLAVLLAATSCKTKYTTSGNIQKEYIALHDTVQLHDSVVHRDSVLVWIQGDTVVKDRIKYREVYKYIYKTQRDTVYKRDSIRMEVPTVETKSKPLSETILTILLNAIAGFIIIAMGVAAFKGK